MFVLYEWDKLSESKSDIVERRMWDFENNWKFLHLIFRDDIGCSRREEKSEATQKNFGTWIDDCITEEKKTLRDILFKSSEQRVCEDEMFGCDIVSRVRRN